MTPTLTLIPKNVSGYGLLDGRCFPSSGVSGKAVTATFCISHGNRIIGPRVKIVCRASSSGSRKTPNSSSQSKRWLSRGKSGQNEEEDDFDDNEEVSKPFVSTSNKPSHQNPGEREKEIAELFKRVQVQLRERAANRKVENKVEDPKEESIKPSESIGTLVQLLAKHSSEKGKGSTQEISSKDKSAENGALDTDTYRFSNKKDVDKPSYDSSSRNPSKFSKKSPIPQEENTSGEDFSQFVARWSKKHTKINYHDDTLAEREKESKIEFESDSKYSPVKSRWTSAGTKKNNLPDTTLPELDDKFDLDSDSEAELDPGIQTKAVFTDEDVYDEIEVGNTEDEEDVVDLNGLKVVELRELAKSRGLKGISKLKKSELIDLLSNSA